MQLNLRALSIVWRVIISTIAFATVTLAPSSLAVAKGADDATLDASPAGISPTTTHLATILAAHDKAVGQLPAGMRDSVVEYWEFTDSGLAGSERLERSGSNYHSRIANGPFVEEYGQFGATRWHQDANGFTAATTQIDERSFYATRVVEDASDPKNDVTVLGETSGPHPAYVLKVKRSGFKHPEFIFYDTETGNVVRVEYAVRRQRVIETYDDFRITNGVSRAWHIHDTDGRPALDDDWKLQSITHGDAIADAVFQMPPHRPAVSQVTEVTQIPSRTFLDGYLVRMTVAGRGYDFLLDSSVEESTIDRNVAREMNLPTYGQTTQLPDGKPVTYRTTIADGDIAGIRLRNFTLNSEEFAYQPDDRTKIVGILGFDFFAANVLHFDFMNRTLEALPVAGFAAAQPVEGSVDVPLTLDDGLPLIAVGIGTTVTHNAVLSTGFPFSIIFGSFVDEHSSDVKDPPGEHHRHQELVPFADDGTFGVSAQVWTSLVADLRFAIGDYRQVGLFTTNYPLTIHDQPIDAIVGMDYLQFYDVYFVYPYNRLIVKPNALFFKTFKKSG